MKKKSNFMQRSFCSDILTILVKVDNFELN